MEEGGTTVKQKQGERLKLSPREEDTYHRGSEVPAPDPKG